MDISQARQRLKTAIEVARMGAQARRQRRTEAERAYEAFLLDVAGPVARSLAGALKLEGYAFTVSTPEAGLRLAWDRSKNDYIELGLDEEGDRPHVVTRVSRTRGSRVVEGESDMKPGSTPEAITQEDVLVALLAALEPWLER